jgi:hypothetical protein
MSDEPITAENIRERATEAAHKLAEEQAAIEAERERTRIARRQDRAVELLTSRFGLSESAMTLQEGGRVSVGDLTFAFLDYQGSHLLVLVGTCGNCKQEALSEDLYSLSALGFQLERFSPGFWHIDHCHPQRDVGEQVIPSTQPPPTAGEALLAALDAYISERTYRGED